MTKHWAAAVAAAALLGAVAVIPGLAEASNPTPALPLHSGTPFLAAVPASGHAPNATAEASQDWSGYAATGATFTSTAANWVLPAGKCANSKQTASFWVGLDGFNTPTVEQTGMDIVCDGTKASYQAWYEMYPRDSIYFSGVTMRAGDHIAAKVTSNSDGSYTLVLSDSTEGWRKTVRASLPGTKNANAEAIVEDLDYPNLADFGSVFFSHVTANGKPIGDFSTTGMYLGNGSSFREDSVSALTGGDAFSLTWLGSGPGTGSGTPGGHAAGSGASGSGGSGAPAPSGSSAAAGFSGAPAPSGSSAAAGFSGAPAPPGSSAGAGSSGAPAPPGSSGAAGSAGPGGAGLSGSSGP